MAAPMSEKSPEHPGKKTRVARALNELCLLNMHGISSQGALQDVINDYFMFDDEESDENDSDFSDTEESADRNNKSKMKPAKAQITHLGGLPCSDKENASESPVSNSTSSRRPSLDHGRNPQPGPPEHPENLEEIPAEVVDVDLAERIAPDPHLPQEERPDDSTSVCSCKLNDGRPCHTFFEAEELAEVRMGYLAMTRDEHDIAILSKLEDGMHLSALTTKSRRKSQVERKTQRTDYYFHGRRICRDVFKYVYGIGHDKLYALIKHYKVNGVETRVHKNSKRLPKNAINFKEIKNVVDFIVNFSEEHAVTLPGRHPGHWKSDVKLLPTNTTKKKVYDAYSVAITEADDMRKVSLRSFYRLWQNLVPFVCTMKPATDLCWFCQENVAKLAKCANLPDAEKSAAVREIEEHLRRVTMERSAYQDVCHTVKSALPENMSLGVHQPCSYPGMAHYSFDFAQQVHFPSNPLQPGPIYFKTPRKCGLFGVCCEALPKQVNFLVEEATVTGKGANCVVSLLHYFFEHYGLGEEDVHLHADNCSGQNKNSCMMQYLMWRVLTGRHRSITLSFLLTGHTKFSPDWCFGLFKRLFRRTPVDCLDDIANCVEESSHVNLSQKCGLEDGTILVLTYNWTEYLGQFFKKVDGIKQHHHFYFSSESPSVSVRTYSDSLPQEQKLLKKDIPPPNHLPEVVPPKGLDAKRQWYLHDEIRPFVMKHECKDVVAPLPNVPKPGQPGVAAGGGVLK